MITRISRGAGVAGLARYLHGPGRANEHTYGGRPGGAVIGGNLAVEGDRDGVRWVRDFEAVCAGRVDVGRPVWHMSMRAAPQDPVLTDAQWADAAQSMGEQMGWAQHPWVVVRHGADHVHVVVSRVGWDRGLWAGRHDFRAAQVARQQVERELGLQAAPVQATGPRPVSPGEEARALRTVQVPERQRLAGMVARIADGARGSGRGVFEGLLDEHGVRWRANVAPSSGRMSGYSFGLAGHVDAAGEQVWFKASALDRALAWKQLEARLGEPVQGPVPVVVARKRFEMPRRRARRVQAAREQAHAAWGAQKRSQRVAGVSAAVARQAVAQRLDVQRRAAASPRTTVPAARAQVREVARMARLMHDPHHPGHRPPAKAGPIQTARPHTTQPHHTHHRDQGHGPAR